MTHRDAGQSVAIHFYATAPYPCSYLESREARSQVAIPSEAIDSRVYSQLVRLGFRRSGFYTYRPYCDTCQACIPVRIPVGRFMPNRSQRRAFVHHAGLEAIFLPLAFYQEHFDLYQRYQQSRHSGGGMANDNPEQYSEFILKSGVESYLVEFRDAGRLVMVSLIDRLDDGISAVYTFYEPDVPGTSYGVFNVVWQVGLAQRLELEYVYLGYWIRDCGKMAYKSGYQPLEMFKDGRWMPFGEGEAR